MNQLIKIRKQAQSQNVEQEFLNQFYSIMTYAYKYDSVEPNLIVEHAQGALEIAVSKKEGIK